jgi:hypothetical protein
VFIQGRRLLFVHVLVGAPARFKACLWNRELSLFNRNIEFEFEFELAAIDVEN